MTRKIEGARETLLKLGKARLLKYGYSGLNIKELARSCGMAAGTFYHYYDNKDELLITILEEDWSAIISVAQKSKYSDSPLYVKLKTIFDVIDEFVHNYNMVVFKALITKKTDANKRKLLIQELFDQLRDMLKYEIDSGNLETDVDLGALSRLIVRNMYFASRDEMMDFDMLWNFLNLRVIKTFQQQESEDTDMELTRQQIDFIIDTNPGDIAIYRLDGSKLQTIYYSENIPMISGLTDKEYQKIIKNDAGEIVFAGDRPVLAEEIMRSLKSKEDIDITYRIYHKERGYTWVRGRARYLGDLDGKPVLLSNFTDATMELDGYSNLVDNSSNIVYVCDSKTYELYYANDNAIKLWGRADYYGKKCYEFIRDHKEPCPWCSLALMTGDAIHVGEAYDPEMELYFQIDCRRILWYGRDSFAVISTDITKSKKELDTTKDERAVMDRIITNIPVGVGVCQVSKDDVDFIATNPYFVELLDITKEKLAFDKKLQKEYCARIHPDDAEMVSSTMRKMGTELGFHTSTFRYKLHGGPDYRWLKEEARTVPQPDDSMLVFTCLSDITETKKAEFELQNSRNMYESTVNAAQLVVWEYDIKKHRIIKNIKEDVDKFGWPKQIDNVPESLMERFEPEEQKKLKKMYAALDAGMDASCEVWYKSEQGREPCCERIIYTSVYDDEGNPSKGYGIGLNITAQKMAERRYYEQISGGDFDNKVIIAKGHFDLTNNIICDYQRMSEKALAQDTSKTYDDVLKVVSNREGCTINDIELRKVMNREHLIQATHEGETHFEVTYSRAYEGKPPIWFLNNLNTFISSETGSVEMYLYTYDITEKVLQEHIINKLANMGNDMIGLINVNERTFFYYGGDGELGIDKTGYTEGIEYREDVKTQLLEGILPEQYDRVNKAMHITKLVESLDKSNNYSVSFSLIDKEGTLRQKEIYFSYLDETKGFIFFCRSDITEQYEEEQEILRQLHDSATEAKKANDAKSTFLSSMSHDMRTPLNGIIGFTELAIREKDPKKREDYLEKIRLSGSLMLSLVNDTLELSRIESGKMTLEPEVVNCREIKDGILAAVKASADAKSIKLNVDVSKAKDQTVWIDRLKLQEVLLNLISNAIKFTPVGGTVDLIISEIDPPENGMNHKFIIRDSGIGMSQEFIPTMFEPFSQENRAEGKNVPGTGLGLSIVKNIVDILDGKLYVKSEIGKGTQFTVYLPIKPIEEMDVSAPKVTVDLDCLKGKTVLVCEDNYLNMEIAKTFLENKKMIVECAKNGQEGIDKFSKSKVGEFAAILMDIRMPIVNGYEATKAIRNMNRKDAKRIPIIAMTADAYAEDIKRCKYYGMDDHIPKPIDSERLYKELAQLIMKSEKEL